MEREGVEVPGVSCGSWLKAGTPPLRESCACPRGDLFEAADSAYTLRGGFGAQLRALPVERKASTGRLAGALGPLAGFPTAPRPP